MRTKWYLAAVVILFFGLLIGCGRKEKGTGDDLIVAMELVYPPFETKDEQGNPSGVGVEIAKALGEYLGRPVRIENTAWDGLIPSLQTGKADVVISSLTITEERAQQVDFSKPYANSLLALLTYTESQISSVEDLNQAGKRIAVKAGTTGHLYAQNYLPNVELIVLSNESSCITEVAQGKADGFIYDQLSIYYSWQKHKDTTTPVFIPFQEVDYWGMAVKKGNTKLLEQVNAFIDSCRENGEFDELTERYLSEEKQAFEEFGFQWFFDVKQEETE
ncbi:MAG: transporter substrate-binding domain-containing protein [Lachnospiraceae bacterium]|jgi:polar amino acid transport system substrate-binding protein